MASGAEFTINFGWDPAHGHGIILGGADLVTARRDARLGVVAQGQRTVFEPEFLDAYYPGVGQAHYTTLRNESSEPVAFNLKVARIAG